MWPESYFAVQHPSLVCSHKEKAKNASNNIKSLQKHKAPKKEAAWPQVTESSQLSSTAGMSMDSTGDRLQIPASWLGLGLFVQVSLCRGSAQVLK